MPVSLKRHLFAFAVLGLVNPACRNGDRASETTPTSAIAFRGFAPTRIAEIYFSTEVSGYVQPCGCTTKPLGGIQRLASVLERGHKDRALVDAGNLLFPNRVDEITREQHLLKARLLARVYRRLGAVAINVAENDFIEGVELLKELQRE